MDNLASSNAPSGNSPDKPVTPHEAPAAKETPAGTGPAVSRAPLTLGGAGATPATPTPAAHSPAMPSPAAHSPAAPSPAATSPAAHAPAPQPLVKKPMPVAPVAPVAPAVPSARTTNCKNFFTKLHPGAIIFLDEQISKWLKDNPNVVVKHTNVTTGDVQDKKTEPNIIITIWY